MRLVFILCLLCILGYRTGYVQATEFSSQSPEDPPASILSRLNASGSVRFDYFSSSMTLNDDSNFFGSTAQLELLPVFSDLFDGKAEGRFTIPDIAQDRTPTTASLLEGYISMHLSQMRVTLGKQIVAWGRADIINPTDNLTPRNYTLLLPFEEDQRFGTTSLKVDFYPVLDYTVTFFTTPLFEPSTIPLPLPSGASVQSNHKPAATLSNSEVGLKLNKTGIAADWSVSYYHGFSLYPEITFQGLAPEGPLLGLRYPEINVFGADAASTYGQYGFRAEAAYITPENYSSTEPTTIQPYLFYVLGADRTVFENLGINVQFVGRWVPGFNDPEDITDPAQRTLAIENAILFGQRHELNYGLTFRVVDLWLHDTLKAELLLVSYFDPLNAYVRPLVTYDFTDRIKGSIGANLFSGSSDSYFGLLKDNNGIFAEVRYSF